MAPFSGVGNTGRKKIKSSTLCPLVFAACGSPAVMTPAQLCCTGGARRGTHVGEPRACSVLKVGLGAVRLLGVRGEQISPPRMELCRPWPWTGWKEERAAEVARGRIEPGLCGVGCPGSQERKGFRGGRRQLCQIPLSSQDGDREAPIGFEHGAPWQPESSSLRSGGRGAEDGR